MKYLTTILFLLSIEYYLYLNQLNTDDLKSKKIWIPPMMGLLHHVVYTVDHLVTMYFYTFIICFTACLDALCAMIFGYFHVLNILIVSFLHFPTNIISIFGMGVALHYCRDIIRIIFKHELGPLK
tara:strand:+ start:176 stop:550 length:375 start_codon:yes stop_codon:yes gene_type:complete